MRRPRPGTVLALLAVGALVALWVYLLVLADPDVPDELDDPAYGAAAEEVCAGARAAIDDLDPAVEAETPQQRGAIVADANTILAPMVDDLAALAPTDGRDARLIAAWLADWATYLDDRERYADELLAGEPAELLITARGTDQITETIDRFAAINDMVSCEVPLDA